MKLETLTKLLPWFTIVVSGYTAFAVLQTKHEALAQEQMGLEQTVKDNKTEIETGMSTGMQACWDFKGGIDEEIKTIRESQIRTEEFIEYLKNQ